MTPLLELRNELDEPDRDKRDFRRMNGHVQLFHDRTVPGPYTKEAREHWLRRVLEAQQSARENGPAEFRDLQLITLEELHEIRRHLAAREARVRRQPAADLRGGDRRAVPQAARRRQRPPGRRLGAAPGGLRRRRGALRPPGRPARGRAAVPRHDPAGRRHRCAGEVPQGGGLRERGGSRRGPHASGTSGCEKLRETERRTSAERRQLVLFREDLTNDARPTHRVDQNDSGAADAAELLPVPRRADLRPHPAARAAKRGHAADRPVRRASTAPARRRCSTRSSSRSTARGPGARSGPSLAYDEFLRQSIHHGVSESEGAGVVALVPLRRRAAKSTSTRSAGPGTCRAARCGRSCGCSLDGLPDRWHSEHWNQLVEDFFPLEVSQLFFFDAEKIRSLAEDETSSQVLGTAVKSLLGLDIAERLIADAASGNAAGEGAGGRPSRGGPRRARTRGRAAHGRARCHEDEARRARERPAADRGRSASGWKRSSRRRAAGTGRHAATASAGSEELEAGDRRVRVAACRPGRHRAAALPGGRSAGTVERQDEREQQAAEAEVVRQMLAERDDGCWRCSPRLEAPPARRAEGQDAPGRRSANRAPRRRRDVAPRLSLDAGCPVAAPPSAQPAAGRAAPGGRGLLERRSQLIARAEGRRARRCRSRRRTRGSASSSSGSARPTSGMATLNERGETAGPRDRRAQGGAGRPGRRGSKRSASGRRRRISPRTTAGAWPGSPARRGS